MRGLSATPLLLALPLVLAACDVLPFGIGGFDVRVVDQDGTPVPDATVAGGIDWDAYAIRTDASGVARVPARAQGTSASIRAYNHVAVMVDDLEPARYEMQATPGRVAPLGSIWGHVVAAADGTVTTVDANARLHRYRLSTEGTTQVFEGRVEPASGFVNAARIERDTLWLADGGGELWAYSLQEPDKPRRLFGLPLLVFDWATLDGVRVGGATATQAFRYAVDGTLQTLATFPLPTLRRAHRLDASHAVLAAYDYAGDPLTLAVVDASTLDAPRLTYRHDFSGATSVAFHADTAFVAYAHQVGDDVAYTPIVFTDPGAPTALPSVISPAELDAFLSDSVAVGTLRVGEEDPGELAFLVRRGERFELLATAGYAPGSPVELFSQPPAVVVSAANGADGTVWTLTW